MQRLTQTSFPRRLWALLFLASSAFSLFLGCAHSPVVPTELISPSLRRAEKRLIALTNLERKKHDLGRNLKKDSVLRRAALQHSEEMRSRLYFAHESPDPELHSPMDRYLRALEEVKKPRPAEIAIGENLYIKESSINLSDETVAEEAQRAFMNSPGHRENLLHKDWRRIGVGINKGMTDDGNYLWLVTVLFRGILFQASAPQHTPIIHPTDERDPTQK